ncbi:choline ABC transporter permease subunit [Lentibacter sp. XHP0401]|jgi:glycine betaine/proline transport system permease protein|uniref:choline ABC transporter permease subunit n=1 Tax=Lentibacter sp. XHP0401 TaxID=2984334 RepID=UPI0021E827A6|nr:choline ABC transporter permease subunit [Lentibacter sp. XHP0401]MCV2891572.1 choline ABC transporter permease subunit [Lentibacter sp. XHP0401]
MILKWPNKLINEDGKLEVGKTIAAAFDWLTDAFGAAFDVLETVLSTSIDGALWLLQFPPPFLMVALFAALTWALQRSFKRTALVALCFAFVINQGYWEEATESLALILFAGVFCMGVGVPIGIYAAHRPRFYQWLLPVLDMMQTIPTFVYLIPMIVLFGIGMVPGLVATFIFVLAAPIRLTHLGISRTPVTLIEAARAFGATPRQLLWKVELPSALPQIMAGLNQTIMLSLSMVVIAALVGADGLGVPVVRALNSVNASLGFESGLVIVAVAIALDRMLRVETKS